MGHEPHAVKTSHNKRIFLNAPLILGAFVTAGLVPVTAFAETVSFSCGGIKFKLETEQSTIENNFTSIESVTWHYDGEWIRWLVARNGEAFGVNTMNGYFIKSGKATDAGCTMHDPSIVAKLPISEGAALRQAFVSMSELDRKQLQQNLKDFEYYESTVDGLWGRGTEAAIMLFFNERRQSEFRATDIKTELGALNVLLHLSGMIHEGDECEECESEPESHEMKQEIAIKPEAEPRKSGEEVRKKVANSSGNKAVDQGKLTDYGDFLIKANFAERFFDGYLTPTGQQTSFHYDKIARELGVTDIIYSIATGYVIALAKLRTEFPSWKVDDLFIELDNISSSQAFGDLAVARRAPGSYDELIETDLEMIVATSNVAPEQLDSKYRSVTRAIQQCLDSIKKVAPSLRPVEPGYECTIAAVICEKPEFMKFVNDWEFVEFTSDKQDGKRYTNGLAGAEKLCGKW
ncbi:hypothetical protein ACSSVY_001316 [Roseovarius sp. MBR-51]